MGYTKEKTHSLQWCSMEHWANGQETHMLMCRQNQAVGQGMEFQTGVLGPSRRVTAGYLHAEDERRNYPDQVFRYEPQA